MRPLLTERLPDIAYGRQLTRHERVGAVAVVVLENLGVTD